MNAHARIVRTAYAVAFLQRLDLHGRHHLTALDPETGEIEARYFPAESWGEIAAWIEARAHRNLYYSVNEPIPDAPHAKLRKEHIARIRAIVADLDPAGSTPEETQASRHELLDRAHELADDSEHPPTLTVDSGNGVQFAWILREKLNPAIYRIDAEDLGAGIAAALDGDAVQNIDRIMRLPGTINHSAPKKRARGLMGGPVTILDDCSQPDRVYTIEELETEYDPIAGADQKDRDAAVQAAMDDLDWNTAEAGPGAELVARMKADAEADPYFKGLLSGRLSSAPGDGSGSAWRAALAGAMARKGYELNDYAAVAFVYPPGQPGNGGPVTLRMVARDWARVGKAAQAAAPKAAEMFVAIEAEPDTSMFPAPVPESFDTYDLLATTAPAPVIQLIDPADWYGREPNVKEWYVEAFVPRGEVTMLTGKGGVGKSLLALQLLIAVALGIPFLGLQTRRAKCLGFFCEDDPDVLHARVRDICRALGRDERELSGWLYLVSRKYDDNLLCTFDRHGSGVVLKATPLFEELVRVAKELGVELSCLDTIADIFGGDEINRQQVRQFVQGCAGRLAAETGGACLMLGHPSRAGEQNGEGTSGSTAWHGSVRSRFYLDHIGDEGGLYRELTTKKSNYGPAGAKWKLMWKAGVLEVVTASRAGSEGAPEITGSLHRIVLDAVANANSDGVRLGLGKTSKFKAEPTLRRREPGPLAPYSAEEVEEALQQLVALGAIVEAEIGRDSSRRPIMSLKAVAETAGEADISSEEGGLFD